MTSHPTILERLAFANAASAVLSFSDENFIIDPFAGFQAFATAVSNKANPDGMSVGMGFENDHDTALEHICSRAHAFIGATQRILEMCKTGIVQSAIDGTLDSDMNCLDMAALVEVGHRLNADEDIPTFDEDMAHDYIASHGFGVPTVEGLAHAKLLYEAGDDYATIGHEIVARGMTMGFQTGDDVLWRDPDSESQPLHATVQAIRGDTILCKTSCGGYVEAPVHQLVSA